MPLGLAIPRAAAIGRHGSSVCRAHQHGIKITIAAKNIGYELRCADPIPYDMDYARDLGFCAAKYVLVGGTAAMVSMHAGLAARCFGASDVRLEAATCTLPSFQSIGYEAALLVARSELGFDVFEHLHCEGASMPVDQVDELFGEHANR